MERAHCQEERLPWAWQSVRQVFTACWAQLDWLWQISSVHSWRAHKDRYSLGLGYFLRIKNKMLIKNIEIVWLRGIPGGYKCFVFLKIRWEMFTVKQLDLNSPCDPPPWSREPMSQGSCPAVISLCQGYIAFFWGQEKLIYRWYFSEIRNS